MNVAKKMICDAKYRTFEFECVRSKRKSLGIQISSDGRIIVRAPINVTNKFIIECVKSREDWILEKNDVIQKQIDNTPPIRYVEGEFFMFLGEKIPLLFRTDDSRKHCKIYLDNGNLVYENGPRDEEVIQKELEKWYRKTAQEMVEDRVGHYMKYFDVEPTYIKVKTQKKRWGSCSSKRHLLFNFNLIKAPIDVLDYIVIHEMCHMVHMNHSSQFWDLVSSILPHYKKQVDWLKKNGRAINKC